MEKPVYMMGNQMEQAFLLKMFRKIWNTFYRNNRKINNHLLLCTFLLLLDKMSNRPREGGSQKSFIRRGSAPRSNPLPSYIHFFRKGTPFVSFYWEKAPLSYTFLIHLNKSLKQEVVLPFFHVARNKLK